MPAGDAPSAGDGGDPSRTYGPDPVIDPLLNPAVSDRRRKLTRNEEIFWYTFAAVTYIAVAVHQKWLLTWLLGPGWLVAVIVLGPRLVDRVTGRSRP